MALGPDEQAAIVGRLAAIREAMELIPNIPSDQDRIELWRELLGEEMKLKAELNGHNRPPAGLPLPA